MAGNYDVLGGCARQRCDDGRVPAECFVDHGLEVGKIAAGLLDETWRRNQRDPGSVWTTHLKEVLSVSDAGFGYVPNYQGP